MWFRATASLFSRLITVQIVIGSILLGLFSVLPAAAQMSTSDIKVVEDAIIATNADWEAGENAITAMSAEY